MMRVSKHPLGCYEASSRIIARVPVAQAQYRRSSRKGQNQGDGAAHAPAHWLYASDGFLVRDPLAHLLDLFGKHSVL
jgi:hypothetical protein